MVSRLFWVVSVQFLGYSDSGCWLVVISQVFCMVAKVLLLCAFIVAK